MIQSLRFLALAASLVPAQALRIPSRAGQHYGLSQALYFLENDSSGAKLAAVGITENGSLGQVTETSTGGKGQQLVNSADGTLIGPDSLNSQGVVATGDDYIFTVNPGSNTVVMFKINPADPLHPTIVGEPVDSVGDFPMSVTYSPHLKTVCVLNGGARNGVACFSVSPFGLKPLDSAPRSVSPALQQSVPPNGPNSTASQVAFSPNSKYVVADIKGTSPTPGTLFVWKVQHGIVSTDAVTSQIPGLYNAFGFSFAGSDDKIFVSSPQYGGSFLALDPHSLKLTQTSNVTVPGQVGSCWSAYCAELDTAYAVAAARPAIGIADAATEQFAGLINYDAGLVGAFDDVVEGTTMFFAANAAEIGAVDLKTKKQVAAFNLSGKVGDRKIWQGLALWSPGR